MNLCIIQVYSVLFGLEIASIFLHRGYGTERLSEAAGQLYLSYERGALEENLYLGLLSCGLLMLPLCAAVLLQGRSIGTLLSLALALAPMVAITAASGLYYLDIRHGITWQPRFVLIWTVGLVGVLVTTKQPRPGSSGTWEMAGRRRRRAGFLLLFRGPVGAAGIPAMGPADSGFAE